ILLVKPILLTVMQSMTPRASEWIMDSGCTNHMTGDQSLLMDSTLRPSDKSHITFADTGKSKVLGLGRVAISRDQHMDKVMLVESLGFNLMSVSMLCDLNMVVIFGEYRCLVPMESNKSLVFEGYRKDVLYMVDFSAGPQLARCLLTKASECWLWHRRLGHARMRNLHTLVKKKHVIGIEEVKFKKHHLCGACEAGKMTRAKHPSKTIMTTSQPFELLHMDLFGPTHYSTLTTTACLYGFVIVDDYSRYTWVHIILYKTEVQDVFRCFANRAMNNYGVKIKHIKVITALNSRTLDLIFIWIPWESLMSSLLHTHLSKMASWSARTEPSLRWLEQCSTSTRHQESSGLKPLIQLVT